MKLLLIGALTALALSAQTVEVTVVSAEGGTPISGVKVELAQNEQATRRGDTNERGAVRFEGLPAGDYTVELTKPGYRHLNRPRRKVHLEPGGNPVQLQERMLRLGSVSGKVTGEGREMPGAEVQLLIVGDFVGQILHADARGEYRFNDVDPGTYVVSARTARDAPPPAERDGRKFGWLKTWHPAAVEAAGALRFAVGAGSELTGQNIELRATPLCKVSGRVLSPNGEGMPGVTLKAAPPDEFALADFEVQTQSREDGAFEFDGLPDGAWRITAEAENGGEKWYVAAVETVQGRDRERVELRFVPPFAVTGKVVRPAAASNADTKAIGVMLAPREGGYRLTWGTPKNDGSFRIDGISQGIYRVQPTSPGPPYYLARVEMGARDVTGEWIEITPGALPLTVTYRADGGTVRGSVEDCNGATIVIVPREPVLQYSEFVRQVKCASDGRYEIGAVRPGEYFAFAFDKPLGMLEFGTVAGRWAGQAVRVTVRAGEATDASLRVTQRGAY